LTATVHLDEPHKHQLDVACEPQRAFELFTVGMGQWWDPAYSPDPTTYAGIDVDPRVGGLVQLVHGTGASQQRFPFMRITRWVPGKQVVADFWLAMPEDTPSRLQVDFTEEGSVCLVELTHTGWTAANAEHRRRYNDWPLLLTRFAVACART
jgi:hypothetical protein